MDKRAETYRARKEHKRLVVEYAEATLGIPVGALCAAGKTSGTSAF
ncbi:MAG: hypothetical protein AAF500_12180 [Myxococcota bacterium]